ncbi:ankyrin repeat protein, partial [Acephala macrosclerotiorum]
SPLHLAASQGFLTIFRLLLFAGSNSLALNAFGLTPLHIAVLFGQEAIVKLAIEYGLDLNVPDESHGTLLHTAAFCNNRNICELLLNAGADRERRN